MRKRKTFKIYNVFKFLITLVGFIFISDSEAFSKNVVPEDIKYIIVWDSSGGCISFPLDENPRFEYKFAESLVNCITNKQKITLDVDKVHKYTLDSKPGIPSAIVETVSENGEMQYRGKKIYLNDFKPDTEINVYMTDGTVVGHYKVDASGISIIPTESWQPGVYVIKVNKVSYKIYKK